MGLQEAFDNVRPGERINYRNGDTLVSIKPMPQDGGRLDARVWIQQVEDNGQVIITSPAPEPVDTGWIARAEQLLRDSDIGPDAYDLGPFPVEWEDLPEWA